MMLPLFNNQEAGQFAFVAKISAIVSLIALLAMTGVVLFLTKDGSGSYMEQLLNIRLSHQRLMPLVVIVGLLLLAAAGILTWLIALYSSFRVAGPLFRFACNIEMILQKGLVTLVPIRRDDCFQAQSRALNEAVSAVRGHYSQLEQELVELRQLVEKGELSQPETRQRISQITARMAEIESEVDL